ncbi:MAG: Uma2 family endonuclease [Oscillochloris sp.]|nr:Uma2 family endonuclease [Oscillochloris sp.]
MAIETRRLPAEELEYPSSDGQPMADNTKQFRWIVTIQGGLDALFQSDPNVFVAGDLLWYPVEGRPALRRAPDALVVFGRPKGDRRAYLQWKEDGIGPQVVFEVLSPKNTVAEMFRKLEFYDDYGVEEYYLYDLDGGELTGWQRHNGNLRVIETISGWVSPRLGVRFDLEAGELVLTRPDGTHFLSYVELANQRDQERERAERLAARLRALGIDPDAEK